MVGRDFPSPEPAGCTTRLLTGVIVGTLFLAVQPTSALAAARLVPNCDRVARDLQSADVSVDSLKVEIVDHMTEDHGATDGPGLSMGSATAPLLFLTPRVAHILEDIFGDAVTAEMAPVEPAHKNLLTASTSPQSEPPAPGTEAPATGGSSSDDVSPDIEPAIVSGPMTETFYDVDTLPHFQRQMFRTDI